MKTLNRGHGMQAHHAGTHDAQPAMAAILAGARLNAETLAINSETKSNKPKVKSENNTIST